jgi:hypothetical protein
MGLLLIKTIFLQHSKTLTEKQRTAECVSLFRFDQADLT